MATVPATSDYTDEQEQNSIGALIRHVFKTSEFALLMLLIIGGLLVSLRNPRFLIVGNIQTLGRDIALIGILGVGEAFVILLGGIDLSIGSVYGLAGVLVAFFSVVPDSMQMVPTLGLP